MFTFTPVRPSDFPRLRRWLMAPHVRAWWGDPARELAVIRELMAADWAEPLIVSWQGRAIGYLQVHDAAADTGSGWPVRAQGTFGIDMLIGEAGYVGRGLGSAFVGTYTDRLLLDGRATCIISDPDPANRRSIGCLERAGFIAKGTTETPDGPSLLMEKTEALQATRPVAP
jgi:aminoglycoside 6'-N-acetyltransferase